MKNEKSLCYPDVSCVLPVSLQYKFSVLDFLTLGFFVVRSLGREVQTSFPWPLFYGLTVVVQGLNTL